MTQNPNTNNSSNKPKEKAPPGQTPPDKPKLHLNIAPSRCHGSTVNHCQPKRHYTMPFDVVASSNGATNTAKQPAHRRPTPDRSTAIPAIDPEIAAPNPLASLH
jgi:hypothetical protein